MLGNYTEDDSEIIYFGKQTQLNPFPNISLSTLNMHSNRLLSLQSLPPHSIYIKLRPAIEDRLHLLNAPALGLFEEEEHKRGHHDVQCGVEQEDVRAHLRNHVRRNERVHEIEEPLCGNAD